MNTNPLIVDSCIEIFADRMDCYKTNIEAKTDH